MSKRCYYRLGGREMVEGLACEVLVADEAREAEWLADGWRRSVHDLKAGADELSQLREQAKARGIKGWQRMGEDTLRERLNDGDDQE